MKQYIGDGVYAEWDGGGIWLTTERQDDRTLQMITHRIYLDGETYGNLMLFIVEVGKSQQ